MRRGCDGAGAGDAVTSRSMPRAALLERTRRASSIGALVLGALACGGAPHAPAVASSPGCAAFVEASPARAAGPRSRCARPRIAARAYDGEPNAARARAGLRRRAARGRERRRLERRVGRARGRRRADFGATRRRPSSNVGAPGGRRGQVGPRRRAACARRARRRRAARGVRGRCRVRRAREGDVERRARIAFGHDPLAPFAPPVAPGQWRRRRASWRPTSRWRQTCARPPTRRAQAGTSTLRTQPIERARASGHRARTARRARGPCSSAMRASGLLLDAPRGARELARERRSHGGVDGVRRLCAHRRERRRGVDAGSRARSSRVLDLAIARASRRSSNRPLAGPSEVMDSAARHPGMISVFGRAGSPLRRPEPRGRDRGRRRRARVAARDERALRPRERRLRAAHAMAARGADARAAAPAMREHVRGLHALVKCGARARLERRRDRARHPRGDERRRSSARELTALAEEAGGRARRQRRERR